MKKPVWIALAVVAVVTVAAIVLAVIFTRPSGNGGNDGGSESPLNQGADTSWMDIGSGTVK